MCQDFSDLAKCHDCGRAWKPLWRSRCECGSKVCEWDYQHEQYKNRHEMTLRDRVLRATGNHEKNTFLKFEGDVPFVTDRRGDMRWVQITEDNIDLLEQVFSEPAERFENYDKFMEAAK